MSILLKQVNLNNQITDILISQGKFALISPNQPIDGKKVIDCTNMAVLPAFYNNHSHAPMSIFRGIGDDKSLFDWLNQDIWPREAKLTDDMIYTATKFAILEMVKTGTVFFADMYFGMEPIMEAVADMGIRAALSFCNCDLFDEQKRKKEISDTIKFLNIPNKAKDLIIKTLSVHAIYSTSAELIKFNVDLAKEHNMHLQIHACETKKEVEDCIKEHGCTPIEYLDKLGALTDKTLLAHCVWLSDKDIEILAKNGVWLCTNPSSNYKLASGVFMLQKLLDKGCNVCLGTDGMASNNNLSMLDEMKLCALSAKIASFDPTAGKAPCVFDIATKNGARAFGLNAGSIEQGRDADCILVDLNNHFLQPNHNLISNMVYSADSSCINTVICNGKILMQDKYVNGQEQIIEDIKSLSAKIK